MVLQVCNPRYLRDWDWRTVCFHSLLCLLDLQSKFKVILVNIVRLFLKIKVERWESKISLHTFFFPGRLLLFLAWYLLNNTSCFERSCCFNAMQNTISSRFPREEKAHRFQREWKEKVTETGSIDAWGYGIESYMMVFIPLWTKTSIYLELVDWLRDTR